MATIEELRQKFFTDKDVLKSRLELLVEKTLAHCLVDKSGQVHITHPGLTGRDQTMLVLVARAIAAELDPNISANVNVADLAKFTALPENQIRARGKDLIKSKSAESSKPGVYRALHHKIEVFLDGLGTSAVPEKQM